MLKDCSRTILNNLGCHEHSFLAVLTFISTTLQSSLGSTSKNTLLPENMDQTQNSTVSSSDPYDLRGLLEAGKGLLENIKSTGTDLDALRGAMKCLEETLDKFGENCQKRRRSRSERSAVRSHNNA
jgi:hypothetical protein